jgi:hypothetical protein
MAESFEGEHLQMVQDCEHRESLLTKWERGFIASIGSQLGNGKSLSPKQADLLDTIWENCTKKG